VRVAVVAELTVPAVTVNVAVVEPAGTVTLEGTLIAVALELESETDTPPVPAAAVRVTVPVPDCPLAMVLGLTEILLSAALSPAPLRGAITPNQGVVPPVQVEVAVWVPTDVAAFASTTNPGVKLGATVIPVYPVPVLPVKLQQGTSVMTHIKSFAFTVEPPVVIVAVVPPVVFPAATELSTSSKQLLTGEQDAARAPAFHSLTCSCR
jgi:hypothetical protein